MILNKNNHQYLKVLLYILTKLNFKKISFQENFKDFINE